jgi:hypothetical protein
MVVLASNLLLGSCLLGEQAADKLDCRLGCQAVDWKRRSPSGMSSD